LLIDAGPRCAERELARALDGVDVKQIVVTHGHEDQAGGLAMLRQRFPDAPIYASRRTLPLIADPSLLNMQRYRQLIWGMPRPVEGVIALDEIDDRLTAGEYTFRVIETPGHSADHISLFEPSQRWLFSGDTFVGGRELAWTPESNLFATIGSLRTLAGLRPQRLFPGSGNIRRTPQPELHAKIGYLAALSMEVGRLEARGLDVAAIVQHLAPHPPVIQRWTLGHFSVKSLVEACRAYNAILYPDGVPATGKPVFRHAWPKSDSPMNRSPGREDRVH
jgi:glyoxylase-like metal-dependent hydrolase (beta-lactamase superfamily II)